jgi:hypothetical protein
MKGPKAMGTHAKACKTAPKHANVFIKHTKAFKALRSIQNNAKAHKSDDFFPPF